MGLLPSTPRQLLEMDLPVETPSASEVETAMSELIPPPHKIANEVVQFGGELSKSTIADKITIAATIISVPVSIITLFAMMAGFGALSANLQELKAPELKAPYR